MSMLYMLFADDGGLPRERSRIHVTEAVMQPLV